MHFSFPQIFAEYAEKPQRNYSFFFEIVNNILSLESTKPVLLPDFFSPKGRKSLTTYSTAMPRDNSIKSILIIGSGPIIIGQACEFDYAGSQASRSLREEGIEVTLINSNPATIMTDKVTADNVYLKPLTRKSIIEILEKHKIDAVLPTMGGQTALNLAID